MPKDAVRLTEAPFVKETESNDSVVLSKFTSDDSTFVALTSIKVSVMFSPFSRISKLALPSTRTYEKERMRHEGRDREGERRAF